MKPLYSNLPFPKLPSELEKISLDISNICLSNENYPHISNYKDHEIQGEYKSYTCDERVIWWIYKNIFTEKHLPHAIRYQIITGSGLNPHVDPISPIGYRYHTLMYVLETGGNPYTNVYVPKTADYPKDQIYFTQEEIVKVYSEQFAAHTWNFLSNQHIHSVTGLSSPRIAIGISFFVEDVPESIGKFLK
jgi:hypothetical protein